MGISNDGKVGTLRAETHGHVPSVCLQGSMIGRSLENGPQGSGINEDVSFTLNATDRHAVVAFRVGSQGSGGMRSPNPRSGICQADTSCALGAGNPTPACQQGGMAICGQRPPLVRRLTPLECLRLQGFPDDWLDGVKGYSDSAAYKAIGNSMAVPCMRWIGERIQMVEDNG